MAKHHRYTGAQHAFIVKHQADIPRQELAEIFNAAFGANVTVGKMNAYCRNNKLKSNTTGRFKTGSVGNKDGYEYSAAHRAFIVKHQAHVSRQKLSENLNAKFGLQTTSSQMFAYCTSRKLHRLNSKGSSVPIGTVHKGGKRKLHIKTAEDTWVQLHRHNYEKAYGPVPHNHTIRFLDGDSFNCEASNLLAVPRSAQGAINSTKTFKTEDIEVNRATMLTASLSTVVKRNLWRQPNG